MRAALSPSGGHASGPLGASSVEQLEESLATVDLELTAERRTRLDAAGNSGRKASLRLSRR